MSGMNPNIHPNSGASAGPGSTTNANAVPLQAIDPTLTQIQPQVALSAPDAHVLGATSQHGLPHNLLGMQPPPMFPAIVAAQMAQHVEQRGLAQDNQGFIAGGDGSGTNAGVSPESVGEGGERIDQEWSGTLAWRGIIRTDTSIERKEVRTQVTATASKGDPCACSHEIEDLYLHTFPD